MKKIALVTDSTSELSQTDARRLGLFVLPNHLLFEGQDYLDGVNISIETAEFYLSQGHELQTLPVSCREFAELFTELLKDHDEVLCVLLSSQLSQNVYNAQQAAQRLGQERRVTVYDSRMVTVGLGRLVLRAKQLLNAGEDVPSVVRQLEDWRTKMVADTIIPMWKRLRSDRISVARVAFSSVLGLSPVVTFGSDGILKFKQGVRDKDALDLLLRTVEKQYAGQAIAVTIGLSGPDDEQLYRMHAALAATSLNVSHVCSRSIGPAVSSHSGLGSYSYVVEPYLAGMLF